MNYLKEHKKIITNEIENELGGDTQALDDKIEMITSEIAYINAKIRSLQSSIAAEQEESCIKTGKAEKKFSFILPENATPDDIYDVVVRILQNLDQFESYTILESFFKDIVELRIEIWSRQMTLEQQEKTITDLRKTLLAMRRAAVLTTSGYEKKNRELEEALRLGGRSLSPEKRELQMDDIENSTSKAIFLLEHRLDQAYVGVEAAFSAGTFGTPSQIGSSSRHNSYFVNDDAAYFFSSLLSASPMNTGNNNRASFSRSPVPLSWLNLQPRVKVSEQVNEIQSSTPEVPTNSKRKDSGYNDFSIRSVINNNVRPSNSQSKDENISPSIELGNLHLERTSSLSSQFFKRTRSIDQPLERSRSSDQHLERRKSSVQFQVRFTMESGGDCPRVNGYLSSGDRRRSQSSIALRGSKDIIAAYHMRQSPYGHSSPDSSDAVSVTSTTSEREKRALMSLHTHTRSETPTGDNIFDRLSKSQNTIKLRDMVVSPMSPVSPV
ncbi:unnamed protein product [Rhizophagus irregularis]|nr:unnamed protein product [Rhizophagus irregularis]